MDRRHNNCWDIIIFIIYLYTVHCVPIETNLVVTTTENAKASLANENKADNPINPKITDMKVEANITNRFCKATVISEVHNSGPNAQIATFAVIIPEQAYISGFAMEIDSKIYEAYVQDKEQAKYTFDKAVASGLSAGHVGVSARDSNKFAVSVNVEPDSKTIFYLTYEELLKRINDKYEIVVNIHPAQPVENLSVEVRIDESKPLKFVKAANLRTGNEIAKEDEKLIPDVEIIKNNDTSALVKFSPSISKQKELGSALGGKQEYGLAGQFVVVYDVERDPSGGEVLVDDAGYFVHFLAPAGLRPLPKLVVFVLDTSGSMEGRRIVQLKDAINGILEELTDGDRFAVVEFSSAVKVWDVAAVAVGYEVEENPWTPYGDADDGPADRTKQVLPPSLSATQKNKEKAFEVVNKLEAFGGTDIKSALKVALEVVENNKKDDDKRQAIIFFLTDGEATVGETDNDKIISTTTKLNGGRYPIFSLSFGDDADRNLLQRLSLQNLGFSRHIYEASDASLQLQEFYQQISSPVLANVSFKYTEQVSNATDVTEQDFALFFDGSELVVAGVLDVSDASAPPAVGPVVAWDADGAAVELQPAPARPSPGRLGRLWAYLTVRQLLEKRDASAGDAAAVAAVEAVALDLALRHSFVTDVTSLVVVRPNDSVAVEAADAGVDLRYPIIASGDSYVPVMLPIDDEEDSPPGDSSNLYSYAEAQDVTYVKSKLPWSWLYQIATNNAIEIDSERYKLDVDRFDTILDKPACNNVVASDDQTEGVCTLIRLCPQAHNVLTDFEAFKKFFCNLNGYAGVCCQK